MIDRPCFADFNRSTALACWLACALPGIAAAQGMAMGGPPHAMHAAPQNVVQISASAQREVVQDWLEVVLAARHQSPDAAAVQAQLKAALDRALVQARAAAAGAAPGGMEVRTGGFSVYPRYGANGQIVGWQGSAELIAEGRDTTRLAAFAGQVPGLTVARMGFSLSRESAQRLESEVQRAAIAAYRAKASEVAQAFGFAGYRLGEVSVQAGGDSGPRPQPRLMAMAADAVAASAPLPAEPGKSLVQVTVSGSIVLQP